MMELSMRAHKQKFPRLLDKVRVCMRFDGLQDLLKASIVNTLGIK